VIYDHTVVARTGETPMATVTDDRLTAGYPTIQLADLGFDEIMWVVEMGTVSREVCMEILRH